MEASETSASTAAPWASESSQAGATAPATTETDAFAERPEAFVGAAFAGGLAVALALRWLGNR